MISGYHHPSRPGTLARLATFITIPGLLALAVLGNNLASAAETATIIPNPASVSSLSGNFTITRATPIVIPARDPEARHAAEYLRDLVVRTHALRLNIITGSTKLPAITLRRPAQPLTAEAYQLQATPSGITLTASSASGLLYAGISLWQLMQVTPNKPAAQVNAVNIDDAPRFAWRGLMLDSARHYQSPQFVRDYIDWMALHKLNVLHWHLTDDQAWRLEIKKYPRLTSAGAWRVPAGAAAQTDIDPATGKPRLYGGFYTQQFAREMVAYAQARGITIVPEIEMPGHATATLVAYPELGATSSPPTRVLPDWGIFPNVYNVEDRTFTFLEDVLKEVMAIFPSKYIHVGGDEVEKGQWKESPAVQTRMRALGISDPAKLQIYFTQRIAKFLDQHGRRLVGWDEVLEPGLPNAAVVMSWRGVEGALKAAQQGYDTVLSPSPTLYFDNLQRFAKDEPPGRGNLVSLETVYQFEPMPKDLTPAQARHVLGVQANLWTEHVRTDARAATMTFPRAAAVAELGWSQPARRNWPDFVGRLASLVGRYQKLKLPYADSAFAVAAMPAAPQTAQSKTSTVALSNQSGFGDIRYTTDGREPNAQSPRYDTPLTINLPSALKAATFSAEQRLSATRSFAFSRETLQRRSSQELKLCSQDIALSFEDDAPLKGPRAAFFMDIGNPCWIYKDVTLDQVTRITASVGQVPFNFQIGEGVHKIKFASPTTPEGELLIHLGTCDGELLARLPLAAAVKQPGLTTLPSAHISPRAGKHDVCMRFAQRFEKPASDPIWALNWIQLSAE